MIVYKYTHSIDNWVYIINNVSKEFIKKDETIENIDGSKEIIETYRSTFDLFRNYVFDVCSHLLTFANE